MPTVVVHIANGRVAEVDSDAAELRVIVLDHDAPSHHAAAQLYQVDALVAFAVEALELQPIVSTYLARAAEQALTTPWPDRVPYETAGAATASEEGARRCTPALCACGVYSTLADNAEAKECQCLCSQCDDPLFRPGALEEAVVQTLNALRTQARRVT